MGRGRRRGIAADEIRQTIGGQTPEEWLEKAKIQDPVEAPGFTGEAVALEMLRREGIDLEDLQEFVTCPKGLSLETTLLRVAPNMVQVRSLLRHPNGRVCAHLVRSIDLQKKIAYHNSFVVHDPQDQDRGIGLQTFLGHLPLYEKLGISQIDLYANSQVGGYFWARIGFQPIHPDAGLVVRERLQKEADSLRELRLVLESLEDPRLEETIRDLGLNEEFISGIDHPETGLRLHELSRYRPRVRIPQNTDLPDEIRARLREFDGNPESPRSGKSLLLGSGWAGVFYLDDQEALWEYVRGKEGTR